MIKAMDVKNESKVGCNNEGIIYSLNDIKESKIKLRKILELKLHSCCYLRLCSIKLLDLGYMRLANEFTLLASQKYCYEATALAMLKLESDIKFNMAFVINKALEDVELSKKIEKLEHRQDNEGIFNLLSSVIYDEQTYLNYLIDLVEVCKYNY